MSSLSGRACVDLRPGKDPADFLAELSREATLTVTGADSLRAVTEPVAGTGAELEPGGDRVFVLADFAPQLPYVVARFAPAWARRAVTAGDSGEYGVLNNVLDGDGTRVHSASAGNQHPEEAELPHDDTPETRRAAAELFGVGTDRLDEVSSTWPRGEADGNGAYLAWWEALGATWPEDFEERAEPVVRAGSLRARG